VQTASANRVIKRTRGEKLAENMGEILWQEGGMKSLAMREEMACKRTSWCLHSVNSPPKVPAEPQ